MKWLLQDIVNKSTPEFNFDRVESSFEMLRKCQEHHLTTRAATPEVPNYISGLTSGVINFSANDHDLLHSSQLFWYRVGFEVCWKPFQVLVLKFETVGLAVKKWLHLIGGTSQRLGFSKQEWLKFKCFYPWFGIYSLDFKRGFWIQSNHRKSQKQVKLRTWLGSESRT